MAYIANKPVRFDRDYRIGEVIPEGVIASGMARKLAEMGRILCVDLPHGGVPEENRRQPQNDPQEEAENGPDNDSGAGDTDTQPDGESPQEEAENGFDGRENIGVPVNGAFICEMCGRAFNSQQALAAHSRSHKE